MDAAGPQGRTRSARSISSVAATSAPSRQQQQATAVSRVHWAAPRMSSPSTGLPLVCHRDQRNRLRSYCIFRKSLGHSPDRGRSKNKYFLGCRYKVKELCRTVVTNRRVLVCIVLVIRWVNTIICTHRESKLKSIVTTQNCFNGARW